MAPVREPESHYTPEELTTVPNISSAIASQDSTQQKDNVISDSSEPGKRAQGEYQKGMAVALYRKYNNEDDLEY